MTLEEIIKTALQEVGGEVTEQDNIESTKQTILSWFKEQLPKDMEYKRNQSDYVCGVTDGYNQYRQDILHNLEEKK